MFLMLEVTSIRQLYKFREAGKFDFTKRINANQRTQRFAVK